MVWFIVDDGFSSSPKVLGIPRPERLAAVGLWAIAGSWCAKHLTDGRVPAFMLDEWGAEPASAGHLLSSGLWEASPEGFVFHDWEGWQRTREEIEAKREGERLRKQAYRDKKAGQTPDESQQVSHGTGAGQDVGRQRVSAPPNQTLPNQTKPTLLSTKDSSSGLRPDVDHLCQLLQSLIVANGSKPPVIGKTWHDAARLMLDADKREPAAAERLIRWTQEDSFWKANILSMPTFRKKYDQLRLAANKEREDRLKPTKPTPTDKARAILELDYGSNRLEIGQ